MKKGEMISFVIPCYRSEKTISAVVEEIVDTIGSKNDYEIILVNDCSPDNLDEVIDRLTENHKIKAVKFAKNFGQHAGIMAGLRVSKGDYAVVLDDDGQCPIDRVEDLLQPLDEGYDVVFAEYGRQVQSLFKNLCSDLHVFVTNILTEKPKNIQMTNFIAFSRVAIEAVTEYSGPYPVISGLIFRSINKVVNVPMPERKRAYGRTTYSIRRLFELWLNTFTAFSIKPLRFAAVIGLISSIGGAVFAFVLILRRIIGLDVMMGWTSMIAVNLVLGGLTLFVLGILGEYIGRIYMSINNTPQYVIKETINIECD